MAKAIVKLFFHFIQLAASNCIFIRMLEFCEHNTQSTSRPRSTLFTTNLFKLNTLKLNLKNLYYNVSFITFSYQVRQYNFIQNHKFLGQNNLIILYFSISTLEVLRIVIREETYIIELILVLSSGIEPVTFCFCGGSNSNVYNYC